MAKAILEFDLNNEDDKRDFELQQKASDMSYVITEFYANSIRRRLKYVELTKEQNVIVQEIADEWNALLTEYNLHDL